MTAVPERRSAGARRPGNARGLAGIVGAVALAVALAAACGGTAPPTGSGQASGAAASGSAAPAGSGGPAATPRPTPWPGNALLGIEALGVSDGEIRKGIVDLGRGIDEEDLALMRRAADGLAGVEVLLPNAERIAVFPPMQALASGLQEVLPRIADAATRLRQAIDDRDGEVISDATIELTEALGDYARLQPELAAWVEQSIDQQRMLVR
jgi:hypothetical protein